MGDKRTEPGQYYPGGRVRTRGSVAPEQIVVNWTDVQGKPDFSDIDELTSHDGQGKVKEVVNAITERMGR